MTRFFVKTSVKETISYLTVTVQKLNYSWKSYSDGVVSKLFQMFNFRFFIICNNF